MLLFLPIIFSPSRSPAYAIHAQRDIYGHLTSCPWRRIYEHEKLMRNAGVYKYSRVKTARARVRSHWSKFSRVLCIIFTRKRVAFLRCNTRKLVYRNEWLRKKGTSEKDQNVWRLVTMQSDRIIYGRRCPIKNALKSIKAHVYTYTVWTIERGTLTIKKTKERKKRQTAGTRPRGRAYRCAVTIHNGERRIRARFCKQK